MSPPILTSERLLTSPQGFAIETATPAQLAACRIIDGRPLGELAENPDVHTFVGGTDAVRALDGFQAREVVYLASIRSGKTMAACAAAIAMSQRVDVSRLGAGEVPRISIVSLTLDASAVAFTILRDTIVSSRLLKGLLVEPPKGDSVLLRHPSGRPIEIRAVAGAKAGGSLVARWSAGVVFDEAARMAGKSDGVVNLDDARSAILGRLLPGALALYIGSPWAPMGTVYELVQQYWREPRAGIVVLRGSGPLLNPHWWTPQRCAELQQRDPTAYATDVLGEFADPESGLLSAQQVNRATRKAPEVLMPHPGGVYSAAVDPSGGGQGSNATTLVVVEVATARPGREHPIPEADAHGPPDAYFRVVLAREFRNLTPDQYWRQISELLRPYRVRRPVTDQFASSANSDLAARYGLQLDVRPWTAQNKLEAFTNLQTLFSADRIELAPVQQLANDLLSVRKRATQAGYQIVLPRSSDGRHADFAPALAAAIQAGGERARVGEQFILTMSSERSIGGARTQVFRIGSDGAPNPFDPFTEHDEWWRHRVNTGIMGRRE